MWHFGYRIPKSVTYYLNGLFFALETDWGVGYDDATLNVYVERL